ncbi:hypothetical protein [Halomonas llamarensis]|uniref:Uncharacterized protein n=1 Tax=Halomonas llamarensis TaxID=2945104 RepID=A0ABT0SVG2_9GAMM|nr:hypothetical protein [Halomonas llamarensis]MCL7931573.1 hypothetical protein [Halomonas llamarensis]
MFDFDTQLFKFLNRQLFNFINQLIIHFGQCYQLACRVALAFQRALFGFLTLLATSFLPLLLRPIL